MPSTEGQEPNLLLVLATEVTAYLNENVLGPNAQVTPLDLLDALASLGIRLELDPDGESASAYQAALDA